MEWKERVPLSQRDINDETTLKPFNREMPLNSLGSALYTLAVLCELKRVVFVSHLKMLNTVSNLTRLIKTVLPTLTIYSTLQIPV